MGHAVVKFDAVQQALPLLLVQGAQHANSILAFKSEPGMH